MNLEGIGTEGVIILGLFLLIKDVLVPLTKKVFIPLFQKYIKKTPKAEVTDNPGNPNLDSITLAEVKQAVTNHEEADEKRHDEIKEELTGIQKDLRDHEARLRVQENRTV